MFLARRVRSEEEEKIADKILKQYDIEDVVNFNSAKYVMEIDNRVVGVSKVDFHDNIGVLKYGVIDKKETGDGLGDALLRAIFNYCISNDIDKIYYPATNEYLSKFGFIEKTNTLKINGKDEQFSLELELEPFFSSPCKGSKHI